MRRAGWLSNIMGMVRAGVAGALCLIGGCGEEPAAPPTLPGGALALQEVAWNGKGAAVGKVAAVAELGDDTVVFGDEGATVLVSGVVLNVDPSVRAWRGAEVIPAGDLLGSWLVGVDGEGRVRRLKNRGVMEDVSDRYGLRGVDVREVAPLGEGQVGFVLADSLAVADGQAVRRYPMAAAGVAGGSGRAAFLSGGVVRVFTPRGGMLREYPVPGAVAAIFDPLGRLLVATADTLLREGTDGQLVRIHTAPGTQIRGLARAGAGVWVALSDRLALLTGDVLRQGPGGVALDGARLLGSPSGDVWLLREGQLARFAEQGSGGAAEAQWKKSVLPMFIRLCSLCHLPGGSAGSDLSTYASWDRRRALLDERVLKGKPNPMPPAGAGQLTPEEAADLRAWLSTQ